MIEKGLILTGEDAELLSEALEEVKAKCYEEIEDRLGDTQALHALVSRFRAENDGTKEETPQTYVSSLSKRLVLGTIIGRCSGANYM